MNIENIRPITLLLVFFLIIEKYMYTRLSNYLKYIYFHIEAHFGFTRNKSTENALNVLSIEYMT